ncbi:DUF805 domain-containing protein [Emcibacter sp. SYSU 3D8]|uniref:DUF805 domain-containing protein n=1 Tax=Emcibacter sp. SYSU 3D8 TaxID=3133969 RepID=UPI0031FE615F
MDFQTAVRTVLQQKYADFTGRAPRSEYWWWVLAYMIVYIGAAIVGSILGRIGNFLPMLVVLAVIVPTIAVGVRRLHDLDKSGWWLLIGLVPFVGALILIYFFVQRGTAGPNQFGEDPLPQAITAG